MIIQSFNTIIYCSNWTATVAFYEKVLHLPIHFANEWFVEFNLTANARLSVAHDLRSSIKSGKGAGLTISLEVEDIKKAHVLMTESGLSPSTIKKIWESATFIIHDPEGNRIEFWSK